jgi:glycosyltransferase involved in cell wall biosynthesis
LRIGIDCRPLIGEKTGIGRYLWQILIEWAKSNINHELWLYSPREFTLPQEFTNSVTKVVKRIVRLRPSELWMHTILPLQIALDKIDVYWGPNYAQPLIPIPIPKILTVHDLVYIKYPDSLKKRTLWHNRIGLETYLQSADHLIVPSKSTKDDVINKLGYDEKRISMVPLGVSNRFGHRIEEGQMDKDKLLPRNPYFLSVGTLEPRKNILSIIRSFQEFSVRFPNVDLLIVGSNGWGETNKEIQGEDLSRIKLLGYVTEKQLKYLYQNAVAFIYVPFYEGFGLPPLEAMSAGVPVITSNTSSLPEVVGKCSEMVNPLSIYEIVRSMTNVYTDESLREKMIICGKLRANGLTWKKTADLTLSIIESYYESANL